MKQKTSSLTVEDFSTSPGNTGLRHFVAAEGSKFPSGFTYNQPSMLRGVAVCLCVEGSARLRINSRIWEIDPGKIVAVLPNHIVEPLESSPDLELRMLLFSTDAVTDLDIPVEMVRKVDQSPVITVAEPDRELLASIHELILKLDAHPGNASREKITRALLQALVFQLGAIYSHEGNASAATPPSRAEELTDHFLKLLLAHYREERAPGFYADKLFVSTKYLSQVVRETTGETVYSWITRIVMLGAKHLLRSTDKTVLQLSEELNFPNPSFFGRFFRKHAGMTPQQYRKGVPLR